MLLPPPRRLSIKRDKMHILFGGTKLLQSTGDKAAKIRTPDGGCLAVVLRTGFGTAQGALRCAALRLLRFCSLSLPARFCGMRLQLQLQLSAASLPPLSSSHHAAQCLIAIGCLDALGRSAVLSTSSPAIPPPAIPPPVQAASCEPSCTRRSG